MPCPQLPTAAPTITLASVLAAAPLATCGQSYSGTTVGGSTVLAGGSSPERVYRFVVAANTPRPIVFETCTATFDSYLLLFNTARPTALVFTDHHNGCCDTAEGPLTLISVDAPPGASVYDPSVEGDVTNQGT